MDTELAGKAVICTGAAGGIGLPTARLLAQEGAHVLCVERTEELAAKALAELPGEGHAALGCDLRKPAAIEELVAAAAGRLGRIDALAHLAAVMAPTPLREISAETWDLHMEVNARGSFLLARAVAERMREQGEGGRIVLASSSAWLSGGLPERLPYASSKGALTTMARGLARAYGHAGVTVNAIAPGLVETEMMRAGLDEETRASLEAATPLGRFAAPREIATCIVFLLSGAASFVSGATLNVSGGFTLY